MSFHVLQLATFDFGLV